VDARPRGISSSLLCRSSYQTYVTLNEAGEGVAHPSPHVISGFFQFLTREGLAQYLSLKDSLKFHYREVDFLSKCKTCGANLGFFSFAAECKTCKANRLAKETSDKVKTEKNSRPVIAKPIKNKISDSTSYADEIQRILSKPWSQVTSDERKTLCTSDIGVMPFSIKIPNSRGKKQKSNQLSEKDIEITKTWVIPPEGCPISEHKLIDGQMVTAMERFEIPSGEYATCQADGPGLFGIEELDDGCKCFLVSGVFEKDTYAKIIEYRDYR